MLRYRLYDLDLVVKKTAMEWKRAVSADRSMPSDDITYFTPDRGIHRVVEIRLVLRAAEGRNARHGLIGLADLFLRGAPSA